jgi:hypothetical protein
MAIIMKDKIDLLQEGANHLIGSALTAISVGVAQTSLIFANRASIDLQGPFEVYHGGLKESGHASIPNTATHLFQFLGECVTDASVDEYSQTTLQFKVDSGIRIKSDETGFESYVLNAGGGVYIFY